MIFAIGEFKDKITTIVEKYNSREVYLFGSYARNEARDDSDVEIPGSDIRSMFDMGGLNNDLTAAVGKDIDLVSTQTLQQSARERAAVCREFKYGADKNLQIERTGKELFVSRPVDRILKIL